jgi:hypothetical protein
MSLNKVFFLAIVTSIITEAVNAEDRKVEEALRYSDDLAIYEEIFIDASQKAIESEICSIEDFQEVGGWMKATGENRDKPIYFTYCGGFTISNRWYLNVVTESIYQ